MKIAVLGARGQLGRELCRVLSDDVVALGRAEADLTVAPKLRQTLAGIGPRVVINAAAATHVDRAEAEPALAFAVNAFAMRELAAICRDLDAALIHFSTNYVFGLDEMRDSAYD